MKRYSAIDLFCGAGGLSLGLKKAGFDIKLGVDVDEKVLATYKNNFEKVIVIQEDIKKINAKDILNNTKIKEGSNFLLAGCPPCQGFSNIGKRDEKDVKNQLVFEYIRLIKEMKPTFILMENVPGMSIGVGKKIFKKCIEELELQYYIEFETLNAADYGVPQIRKRLVLHGVRKDVYKVLMDKFPKEIKNILPNKTHSDNEIGKTTKKWITVEEVLKGLPEIKAGEKYEGKEVFNHVARNISETNLIRLDYIRKHNGSRYCLTDDLVLKCHKNNISYGDTYGVLYNNKPAPTLTSGCTSITKGRYGHPIQNRGISVREAARIQSFPDDFEFVGNIGSMSLQIGNAVPPKLAEASGKRIIFLMNLYEQCNKI
ncbi:MAG: DNA cytosine methyltransferase [Lachnospiraceae bacterium]|jgi:DNA (cytosine-5)-methyltransferase 1|nr:DNA cytosine methyltransferase [Lachnospiraceae bacterium]